MNNVVWATKRDFAGVRAVDDFYPTPPDCVRALIPHIDDFPGTIWEPACGDGAISKVLLACGWSVASSDIMHRGYLADTIDFLRSAPEIHGALRNFRSIVTNPPYRYAEAFIRRAFDLGCTHIAMLLKSNFWHAKRGGLFEQYPPSEILQLTWRPDFTGAGSPFLDVAWNVWRPGSGKTTLVRLERPKS
jgi:hypothetical protein